MFRKVILFFLVTPLLVTQPSWAQTQYYYNIAGQQQVINQDQQQFSITAVPGKKPWLQSTSQGDTEYTLSDGKNISISLTNKGQSSATDFSAYGNASTKESSALTYDSELADPATELLYLRARNYQPIQQQFTTMDSFPVWNKYSFAKGNPINHIDPSGHMSVQVANVLRFSSMLLMSRLMAYGAHFANSAAIEEGENIAESGISKTTRRNIVIAGFVAGNVPSVIATVVQKNKITPVL